MQFTPTSPKISRPVLPSLHGDIPSSARELTLLSFSTRICAPLEQVIGYLYFTSLFHLYDGVISCSVMVEASGDFNGAVGCNPNISDAGH